MNNTILDPIGSQFRPIGFKLDPDWVKLGPNWAPLGPQGSHWPLELHEEPDPVWEPHELSSAMPSHKTCVFGIRDGIRHRERSGVKKGGWEPTSTRAGGQDDGSYTNSLKLYKSYSMNMT